MTANQITALLLPILIVGLGIVVYVSIRKKRKNAPPQTHAPRCPGAGYDAKEMVRSKGMGMADGGDG